MNATTENKSGVGPEYLDVSEAGIAQRLESLAMPMTFASASGGMYYASFQIADLVMQIVRERTDAFRQGAADQREKRKALQQTVADLDDELTRAKSVVQDMTAIIAAKREQERTLAEQIAQAIAPMIDTDTSDMELPELVAALIDVALREHARAQIMSMEPENPDGVFLVQQPNGRTVSCPCITRTAATARAEAMLQDGTNGLELHVVQRLARCVAHIETEFKEA